MNIFTAKPKPTKPGAGQGRVANGVRVGVGQQVRYAPPQEQGIEIRTLRVNGRSLTQQIFKQLVVQDHRDKRGELLKGIEVWGLVNTGEEVSDWCVVWSKGGLLRKSKRVRGDSYPQLFLGGGN